MSRFRPPPDEPLPRLRPIYKLVWHGVGEENYGRLIDAIRARDLLLESVPGRDLEIQTILTE